MEYTNNKNIGVYKISNNLCPEGKYYKLGNHL